MDLGRSYSVYDKEYGQDESAVEVPGQPDNGDCSRSKQDVLTQVRKVFIH